MNKQQRTQRILAVFAMAASAWGSLASAMDFEYRLWPPVPNSEYPKQFTRLVMSGPIKSGDASRLRVFLSTKPEWVTKQYAMAILNSPGGDVAEAMLLADVIRMALLSATVMPPARCVSACFFLYVAAASRNVLDDGPDGLGIHRPYIAPQQQREISSQQSAGAATVVYAQARTWLVNEMVPQYLIDRMFAHTSQEVYWLTFDDISRLGDRAPWYEEWLLARCPDYVAVSRRFMQNGGHRSPAIRAALDAQLECEADAVAPEQRAVLERWRAAAKAQAAAGAPARKRP